MRPRHEQGNSCRKARASWPLTTINPNSTWLVYPLVIFGLLMLPVAQAQVVRITLKDMVQTASTIVTGRVVDVREGRHPNYQNIVVTYVTVEVEEMLKGGANHQSQHVFMQFGGGGATQIHELPTYTKGEEAVLFLYPESEYGFTSPVGGNQGKFLLRPDAQTGERVVMNSLKNSQFFAGISTQKLSSAELNVVRGSNQPVDYRIFASLVRKLVKG